MLVLLWNAFIIRYPSVAQIPREVVMPIVLTAMWLAVAIGAFRGGKRRLREPPGC